MPLNITSLLITALVSAVIPWLVATVAHASAPAGLKAVLSLLFTAATGVLTGWQADPGYDWRHAVLYAVEGFTVATMAHFGLWKPTQITGSGGAIASSIPGGLGKPRVVDGEVVGRR